MKKVLDKLRNQSTTAQKYEIDVKETVSSDNFKFGKIVRHGFPYQPTCIAFDPVQKLLAIGNQTGSIRIFGQPGVDCHVKHDSGASVLQILFLINEGALISVCTDDTIHLWTFRQKRPEIVNSLQFQKEKLTCVHLPYLSKYLYVGSDRGNVHIVQIENFALSGYVINWNKAIDVSQKTHPGAVCHLSECPLDDSKLLMGYERGTIVLWDLKSRAADVRFQCEHTLRSVCWHYEGKQFMCAHPDGSLTTWLVKNPQKPTASVTPHLRTKPNSAAGGTPASNGGGHSTKEKCKPIYKVDWKSCKNGDDFIIFSGGLPYDETGQMPSVTILRGKSTTVLEMEHSIVTFVTLSDSPYINEAQNPYAVAVLLQTDLVIVDLHTPGYPCFENPYPMDLHESPVTYCTYMADCPSDLIPALYSVGSKQKRQGFSEKNWPIKGGEWSATCRSYPEVVITGHADGSIKFWDASSNGLQVLYKLKCGKIFDKPGEGLPEDLDPFAVQRIALCPFSRLLAVAGQASHVTVYKFCRKETNAEVPVLEVPISYYEVNNEGADKMQLNKLPGITRQDSVGSHTSSVTSEGSTKEGFYPVKVKGAAQKRPVGYQAELVCLTPWLSRNSPEIITALAVNSTYGLLAYGTEQGLAVTDIVQHVVILSIGTPNLYGSSDPYTRVPKSPAANNVESDTPYSPTISDRYEQRKYLSSGDKKPTIDIADLTAVEIKAESKSKVEKFALLELTDENKLDELFPKCQKSKSEVIVIRSEEPSTTASSSKVWKEENNNQSAESLAVPIPPVRRKIKKKANEGGIQKENSSCVGVEFAQEVTEIPPTTPSNSPNPDFVPPPFERNANSDVIDMMQSEERRNTIGGDPTVSLLTPGLSHRPSGKKVAFGDWFKKRTKSEKAIVTPPVLLDKVEFSTITVCEESQEISSLGKSPVQRVSSLPLADRSISVPASHVKSTEMLARLDSVTSEQSTCSEPPGNVSELVATTIPQTEILTLTRQISGTSSWQNVASSEEESIDGAAISKSSAAATDLIQRTQSEKVRKTQKTMGSGKFHSKSLKKLEENQQQQQQQQQQPGWFSMTRIISHLNPNSNEKEKDLQRSRSSSASSQEVITSEGVAYVSFIESCPRKGDTSMTPSLWIGTTQGSTLAWCIQLPQPGDQRLNEPVLIVPSGLVLKQRGVILNIGFLDQNFQLLAPPAESWKDLSKDTDGYAKNRVMNGGKRQRVSPANSTESGTVAANGDCQFSVCISENQLKFLSLPSQICAFKTRVGSESTGATVVRAEVVTVAGWPVVLTYTSSCRLQAYSLPTLRNLFDFSLLPVPDLRVSRTISFTQHGHGLYMCSPTEIQKFSYSAELWDMGEMLGDIFLPKDMPEAPKQSFAIWNLFTNQSQQSLDRDELFGESKGSKSVARVITGGIDPLRGSSGGAVNEVSKAKMLLMERGAKLGEVEDATANMMESAKSYAEAGQEMVNKYKNKKWYQL